MHTKVLFAFISILLFNYLYSAVGYDQGRRKISEYSPVENNEFNNGISISSTGNDVWSGSWDELNAIVEKGKEGLDGQVRTILLPATLEDMKNIIARDNRLGWSLSPWSDSSNIGNSWLELLWSKFKVSIVRFVNLNGEMVVYEKKSGRIVLDDRFDIRLLWDKMSINLSTVVSGFSFVRTKPKEISDERILEFLSCKIRGVDLEDSKNTNNMNKVVAVTIDLDYESNTYHIVNDVSVINNNTINNFHQTNVMFANVRLTYQQLTQIAVALNVSMNMRVSQTAISRSSSVKVVNNVFTTTPTRSVRVDLSQFEDNIQEIIAAYKALNKNLESAIEASKAPTNASKSNCRMADVKGMIARGNAIQAEQRKRWEDGFAEFTQCVTVLNDRTAKLESEFQSLPIENISVKDMNLIRKRVFRPILPYIRKTLEIAKRADPDIADSIIKQFSALEKSISDDDTKFEY